MRRADSSDDRVPGGEEQPLQQTDYRLQPVFRLRFNRTVVKNSLTGNNKINDFNSLALVSLLKHGTTTS